MSIVSKYRTHSCEELRVNNINQDVVLSGWIHNKRDHGGVLFIDLRDHYGITQITSENNNIIEKISHLHLESVITIHGKVVERSIETKNNNLTTGDIEIIINKFDILSESEIVPFQINDDENCNEEMRLKYRFLDLRRKKCMII